jgi:hypothetical protein
MIPASWSQNPRHAAAMREIAQDPNPNGCKCPLYRSGMCMARVVGQNDASAGPEPCSMYSASYTECGLYQMFGYGKRASSLISEPNNAGQEPKFFLFDGCVQLTVAKQGGQPTHDDIEDVLHAVPSLSESLRGLPCCIETQSLDDILEFARELGVPNDNPGLSLQVYIAHSRVTQVREESVRLQDSIVTLDDGKCFRIGVTRASMADGRVFYLGQTLAADTAVTCIRTERLAPFSLWSPEGKAYFLAVKPRIKPTIDELEFMWHAAHAEAATALTRSACISLDQASKRVSGVASDEMWCWHGASSTGTCERECYPVRMQFSCSTYGEIVDSCAELGLRTRDPLLQMEEVFARRIAADLNKFNMKGAAKVFACGGRARVSRLWIDLLPDGLPGWLMAATIAEPVLLSGTPSSLSARSAENTQLYCAKCGRAARDDIMPGRLWCSFCGEERRLPRCRNCGTEVSAANASRIERVCMGCQTQSDADQQREWEQTYREIRRQVERKAQREREPERERKSEAEPKKVEYEGQTDCPRGHGALGLWAGKPRCWTCGWPDT